MEYYISYYAIWNDATKDGYGSVCVTTKSQIESYEQIKDVADNIKQQLGLKSCVVLNIIRMPI